MSGHRPSEFVSRPGSPAAPLPRVVVVGAGFAGLTAARRLARGPVEVVLVDRNNHHLFQALLYQVASAGLSPADVATPIRAMFRNQPNFSVVMGELTRVDFEARQLELDGGVNRLGYDYLILAVGVRTSFFGHPEWARHAVGLKSASEAVRIRESLLEGFEKAELTDDPAQRERLMTAVVVGGGPTGVELAGAFAELRRHVLRWDFRRIRPQDARVVLIEAGPRLLGAYAPRLSESAARHLGKLGVEVVLGERVEGVEAGRVRTANRLLEAGTIVWTAGVQGTELAANLPAPRDGMGRVRVAPDLRLEGQERVYCAGDMARFEQQGQPLPGMAPVALAEGAHAAANVLRQVQGQPALPFRFQEREQIATLGRQAAVFQYGRLQLTGFVAWFAWIWLHLWRIVDLQNRLLVFLRWTWSYFAWKWGVRLILHPPEERKSTCDAG